MQHNRRENRVLKILVSFFAETVGPTTLIVGFGLPLLLATVGFLGPIPNPNLIPIALFIIIPYVVFIIIGWFLILLREGILFRPM